METIVMRQEENEIPSCDLSNFARPNPVVSPSPLTSFASSCAEKGPIVPEIQVLGLLDNVRPFFYFIWGQRTIPETMETKKVPLQAWERPQRPNHIVDMASDHEGHFTRLPTICLAH